MALTGRADPQYSQGAAWESDGRNRRNTCRTRVPMVAATNLRECRANFQPLGIVKAGPSGFSSRRPTCHRSACFEHRSMWLKHLGRSSFDASLGATYALRSIMVGHLGQCGRRAERLPEQVVAFDQAHNIVKVLL